MPRFLIASFAILMLLILSGCGGYVLRGKVVEAAYSDLSVVPAGDNRHSYPGIEGARVHVYRDPGRPNQALVATGVSRSDGSFEIPLEAFGAGWMDEQWQIILTREGYRNVESIIRLPSNPKRSPLLATMTRGRGAPIPEPEDLMREHDRFR